MKKPSRLSTRTALLEALRKESRAMQGRRQYKLTDDGDLVDLARTAAYSNRRYVRWRGIWFPLSHSWTLLVLDPETGKPLIRVPGGALL